MKNLPNIRAWKLTAFVTAILLAVIVFLSAAIAARATESCLICHQYPGLVTTHREGDFLILHIDEQRYAKTPHGNTACEQCHPTVFRIPHTGETQITCNQECHQGEVEMNKVAATPREDFHRGEQSAIIRLDDESSCRVCHPLYPHSENNMVRAFLNLHTGFMFCEVCHLNKQNFSNTFYDWNGREVADYIGEPYGTFYNPRLEKTQESEHFLSRICVYQKTADGQRSLINTWDTERAREFGAQKARLTPAQAAEQLEFFHRDVNRKEISVACDECHSQHSILDFEQLGFSETEINNLIHLNLKGLVTKYKIFYIPHLFDD